MYIIVLITVLVQFSNLISAESGNNAVETVELSMKSQEENNFTANESSTLHIKVTDISKYITTDHCTVFCIHKHDGNLDVPRDNCNILHENQQKYINVPISHSLTTNDSDNWVCQFNVTNQNGNQGNPDVTNPQPYTIKLISFNLTVTSLDASSRLWYYIVAGVSVLVILIIVGQTICIIHFKRKAKAVRVHASLSKRPNQAAEDTARYSSMPGTTIKIEPCIEARESGIYEVLENVRANLVPEPPPLKTLPRKDASHRATSPSTEAPTAASTSARTFTNGTLLPFTLSEKQQKDSDSDSKRSTLERIKVREPMPIPSEEIYEVMELSPTPPRKEYPKKEAFLKKDVPTRDTFPKKVVPKKEELRGFNTQPKKKPVPVPTKVQHGAGALKPQILPSQLREALEHRNRGNTLESVPKVIPFNPGLPPPLATPSRLATAHVPRPVGSARAGRAPPPGPSGSGAPQGPSFPGGPGGPGVSKWRPPPPAKPKQLHPLPPPPRPESIQVTTEGGGEDDSDEEWIYEPLPTISSFNIYSNT